METDRKDITYRAPDGELIRETLQAVRVPDRLLHATPDDHIQSILKSGLRIGMPPCKRLVEIGAVFCTIPSEPAHSSDLFRYYSDWSIVVIDTSLLPEHRWYIDFLAADDSGHGGHNRHVLTLQDIPPEAILRILKV